MRFICMMFDSKKDEEDVMVDCNDILKKSEVAIWAYILEDKQLPKALQEHIDCCLCCRQQLVALHHINKRLVTLLYRSRCPDTMQLACYDRKHLPVDELQCIATHVQECPLCSHELATLRTFFKEGAFD